MVIQERLGIQQAKKIMVRSDVSQLHAFLRLANYYRRFIKKFSIIAKPLSILRKSNKLISKLRS
uniref:Reverse transcriptase/retrotransposon-derived protein RNase H-like domain-containing protein n=1 Tax=Physcomitrium patens TaxID=3218 RepID=A0A2K1JU95_PHYPA|nr:hypothetical protein PHYPA_014874 [Physcomitrium patens]